MLSYLRAHKLITFIGAVLALIIVYYFTLNYVTKEIPRTIRVEASDVSQCKSIPIGHRACGGPDGYMIYSTKTSDIERYSNLVSLKEKLIAPLLLLQEGGASICSIAMPPRIELVDGKCQKDPRPIIN